MGVYKKGGPLCYILATMGADLGGSVVFSCWTGMLDLVEIALDFEGIQFQRIDGRMPLKKRSVALQKFRSNSNCQVLLASVMCAGVGYVYLSD